MSRKLNVYALYKGDEFIDLGTIEELSKKHNYKPESLRHWRTKSYIERNKARKEVEGRKILIKIEEDEEEIYMKKTVEDFRKEGVKVFDEVPDGWIKLNATTQPKGYEWYSNGKSLFGGEYESGLVRKKE